MMKKWIRWKGLIGFAVAVVVLVLFFLLFIDSMIKGSIEYAATRMVGAKVDLDSAEFRFSPLGIQLTRVQITNPDQPMQNIIDIKNIRFNMDGLKLLQRKVLINEMQVEGIRLNTQRNKSGAIKHRPKPAYAETAEDKKGPGLKLPEITIPDADKILAREDIKTIKQAETFKADVKTSQQKWDEIRDNMPGERRINEYSTRLDIIKKTNTKDLKQLLIAIKALKRIKKDIKTDINTVDSSRQQISGDLNSLNRDLQALKNSPQEEYDRLTKKYSVTSAGISNISHLLFGSEAKKYTTMAMGWYKKLQPWLAYVDFSGAETPPVDRHRGLDIRFKEYKPSPDFLIKLLRASVEIRQGNFSGKIYNITNEQDITRKPTTLKFSGNKMQGIGSILLIGNFNHINPAAAKDQLNFNMSQYELNKYRLINRDDMRIYLDKAKSDVKLVAWRKNNHINANFTSHIHSIKYNNQASGNELAMMFLSSINKTRDFNIYGKLRGTFDDYSTKVSSDLDNRLKANMQRHLNRRLAGFQKQLKDKLYLKTRQPIHEAEGKLKVLNSGVKNDIAMRKAKLTQQYNTARDELKQKERQQKARSKAKIKKNLKGLMDKFK